MTDDIFAPVGAPSGNESREKGNEVTTLLGTGSRRSQSYPLSELVSRVSRHAAVLTLYTVIALVIGHSLASNFQTQLYAPYGPGPEYSLREASPFIWYDWWLGYAMFQRHVLPLTTDRIFAPVGINLSIQDLSPFSALSALPVTMADGPIAGHNFALFLGTVLTGLAMYVLARYVLKHDLAAFLAGLFVAFGPSRLAEVYTNHPNVASLEWIPFFLLTFLRTIRREGRASPWLAGVTLFLVALSGYELLIMTGLLALIILAYHHRNIRGRLPSSVQSLAIVAGVFGVLFAPVLIVALPTLRGAAYPHPGILNAAGYSLRPQMFFTPTWNNADFAGFANFRVNPAFVGWIFAPLAGISLARARCPDRKLWITCVIVFSVLSLGPLLKLSPEGPIMGRVAGIRVAIPLPFLAFRALPLMDEFRTPLRFIYVAYLVLALPAADGFIHVTEFLASRLRLEGAKVALGAGTATVLSLAFLLETSALTPPTYQVPNPPLYRIVAAASGDPVVLNLPLGWNTATKQLGEYPRLGEEAQYFETIHEKRTTGGMMMRVPNTTFTYLTSYPVLQYLLDPRNQLPSPDATNPESVARQLQELQIGYIAIQQQEYPPAELHVVQSYITGTLRATLIARDNETILYKVRPSNASSTPRKSASHN